MPKKLYSSIAECMTSYAKDFSRDWGRTEKSLVSEWNSHMILLGKLGYPRSANVDFDKKEEGKGFAYFFKKAIKAAFGMEK